MAAAWVGGAGNRRGFGRSVNRGRLAQLKLRAPPLGNSKCRAHRIITLLRSKSAIWHMEKVDYRGDDAVSAMS